jgi:hypothetical protein
MKNIHILPTDKPSRLFLKENTLLLNNQYTLQEVFPKGKCQNIYITSDEDLILGGYHFNSKYGDEPQKTVQRDIDSRKYWEEEDYEISKIILTDNKDLIKCGVQAIDDEFLEWFVKNPSCEEVEVKKWSSLAECGYSYHIIIPKEEPEQETLEEAAENYTKDGTKHYMEKTNVELGFIAGVKSDAARDYWYAKWQAERMYSEEEVLEIIRQYALEEHLITSSKPDIWFKQFKKESAAK